MLNWPRIRCALFGHGRIVRYKALCLNVYVCERCGQIVAAGTEAIRFIDKVHFAGSYQAHEEEPQLEGVWQEWGRT